MTETQKYLAVNVANITAVPFQACLLIKQPSLLDCGCVQLGARIDDAYTVICGETEQIIAIHDIFKMKHIRVKLSDKMFHAYKKRN